MGGLKENTIANLRVHINNNNIHFHDDGKSLKFSSNAKIFKENIIRAFEAFKQKDGIIEIPGKENSLYIMKKQGISSLFIGDNKDIKKDLLTYLKGC